MKNIFSILISSLVIISISKGIELSRINLSGGISLSGNLYHSKFTSLPNFSQCSADYRSAFGFAPDFFIEAEYRNQQNLFGLKNSFGLKISYSDISANYYVEDFIGYYIRDNDYTRTITEHQLKTDISAIILRPALSIHPFEEYPASFQFGLHLGIPINRQFSYIEILKSPEEAFFINGSKNRNPINDELPQFASVIYGMNIGANYKIIQFGNWNLRSVLDIRYGLNNLISSLNWKYINFTAGIALNYNIPKPPSPPPVSPPYPPLIPPEPPEQKILAVSLNVLHNGKKLEANDMVDMNFNIKRIIKNYRVLPVIYYKSNQIEPEYIDNPNLSDVEKAQANALETFLKQFRFKSLNSITIISYIPEDENEQIAKARIDKLLSIFQLNAINAEQINSEIKKVSLNNIPNLAIRDEFHKVEIKANGFDFLDYYQQDELIEIEDLAFEILPKIETNYDKYEAKGIITFGVDNFKLGEFSADKNLFTFKPSKIKDLRNPNIGHYLAFKFTASANDFGKIVNADTSIRIYLGKKINSETKIINPIELDNKVMEQYILAYFEFDKSDISYLDTAVVNYIKKSIAAGKIIEIRPLTDNIGTDEYNFILARSRALSTIKALQLKSENYRIYLPCEQFFSNDYPYTRILNRSVLVRIPVD